MDKEEFYKIVYDVYNENGYVDRPSIQRKYQNFDVDWQCHKYGGLKKICSELGIEHKRFSKLNKDLLLEDMRRVYNEYGYISKEMYNKYGIYSSSSVRTHIGGFNKALQLLDIPISMHKNITKDEVIEDYKKFYDKYHSTSSTLYRKYGNYSNTVFNTLFDGWVNFINEIGLKPICDKPGKEKMLKDVVELYDNIGFLSTQVINDNCSFTYQAITNYYSMEEISKACGCDNAFLRFESSGEKLLGDVLREIYGADAVIKEYTNDWLINNSTGNHMYVDYVVESVRLAFEYDGEQHYKYVPFLHRKYKNFFNQVCRDRLKDRLLKSHGFKLIRIKFDEIVSVDNIKQKILSV